VAFFAPVLAVACAVLAYLYSRPVPPIKFQRLTFGRGFVHAARFTPDGSSVVYSAQWEDNPIEVFTSRFDTVGARSLGLTGSALRSISSTGELALLQNMRVVANSFTPAGTLARAPFAGGTPRATEDKIDFAEWSPAGAELAIVRETDLGTQLEFPAGKVLYKTAGYISEPRISADGSRIAFLDHPLSNDNGGSVAVVDRAGNKQNLGGKFIAAAGLAWSPKGDEIWFTAARAGARLDLRAVTLGGRERVLLASSVSLLLEDVAKDGRVLIANTEDRMKLIFRGPSDKVERELSWLDWSLLNSLSPDGKYVAFSEAGEGAGANYAAYLRETNGAPAVLLGKGTNPILAPDGKFVVVFENDPPVLVTYPVGLGQSKRIPIPGFTISLAGLLADGKRVWFNGNEPSHGRRYYLTDMEGSKPKPVTPEGVFGAGLVLNGKYLAGVTGGKMTLFPVEGGEAEVIAGIRDGERVAGWSPDGQWLFVNLRGESPTKIYRLNWKTGQREVMLEVTPADRAGVIFGASGIQVTPDGKAYAYSVSQSLGELDLAEGLK
jgi:Tol biopolymer transport system component